MDHFVYVKGMMKVVLYDGRPESPTHKEINEFFIEEHNPLLLQIPPLVYHGFKCTGGEEAIVINCPTETYHYKEPDEYRLPAHGTEFRMIGCARTDKNGIGNEGQENIISYR